jgi:hypothetical protein
MVFKNSWLDYVVAICAFIVFFWAVCFASFHPMKDENGNIMHYVDEHSIGRTIPDINMQVFIAPIVIIYEMIVLIILPGKPQLHEIDWKLHLAMLIIVIRRKIGSGIDEYHEWKNRNHLKRK